MRRYFVLFLMAMMTISVFAQDKKGKDNPAALAVTQILEGQSWVITADHASLANSIAVDDMDPTRNFFKCKGGNVDVKIDFFGARTRSTGMTANKARRMAGDLRSTGNTLATLPPMYVASYKIESQEITVDKKGRHVTARIKYSVEDSNVTNMSSTPELVIHVDTKDMSCDVRYDSFRSGETYYGTLMESISIK